MRMCVKTRVRLFGQYRRRLVWLHAKLGVQVARADLAPLVAHVLHAAYPAHSSGSAGRQVTTCVWQGLGYSRVHSSSSDVDGDPVTVTVIVTLTRVS